MDPSHSKPALALGVLCVLGGAYALALYATSFQPDYGYMLDEFYYLACARHLAWGYPDHPALYPALLRLNVALAGDSIAAIRLLPALAGGGAVVLTGFVAQRLGGGRLAQTVAALAMVTMTLGLAVFSFGSMNCLEALFWTATLWLVAERCRSGDPRLWLAVGAVLGVAVHNKHTILLLVAALLVAVLATPLRRDLRGRWLWAGVLLALALASPNLYWQWSHEWVSLDFYRNADLVGNTPTSAFLVAIDQLIVSNPGTLPIWGAGLFMLLRAARGHALRPLGWVWLALITFALVAGKSRPDRIAGVYPFLFAAGAVQLESMWHRTAVRRATWASLAVAGTFFVMGALAGAPLLPPAWVHAAVGDLDADFQEEVGRSRLPLTLAHRTGWPEFIAEVDRVIAALPPERRTDFVFLVDDYAHAGALELFGRTRGYPAVYSPNNGYYLWGPGRDVRPGAVVAIGIDEAWLLSHFARVEEVGRAHCDYCNLWLDDLPIRLATGADRSLAALWPELKQLPGRKLRMLRAQQAARESSRRLQQNHPSVE